MFWALILGAALVLRFAFHFACDPFLYWMLVCWCGAHLVCGMQERRAS